jgi:DNA-binding CsgD family transcriptional regulator
MAKNPLTPRQSEVVRLLSLGCTVSEAAKVLGISPSTVDNHKARAMAILGTTKTALLTRIAIKLKITSLDDKLTPREKRRRGRKDDGWN